MKTKVCVWRKEIVLGSNLSVNLPCNFCSDLLLQTGINHIDKNSRGSHRGRAHRLPPHYHHGALTKCVNRPTVANARLSFCYYHYYISYYYCALFFRLGNIVSVAVSCSRWCGRTAAKAQGRGKPTTFVWSATANWPNLTADKSNMSHHARTSVWVWRLHDTLIYCPQDIPLYYL